MGDNRVRLSAMMFLQYAVWGVWLPVLGRYLQAPTDSGGLGFDGYQVGLILGLAGSVGAVTSPFIGQVADRMFSAERCLAVLLFLGGIVKFVTANQTSYTAWLILSVVYSVLYMPTISLTNSITFANAGNEKSFPLIRVWGTLGWIAASWIFPWIFLQHDLKFSPLPPFLSGPEHADVTARLRYALMVSGGVSIAYSIYCLVALPHTPPRTDVQELALGKSLALFSRPSFALLVAASLPISVIHQVYFMETGQFLTVIGFKESLIGPIMSIGQFFEIAVMAALPFLLLRLGFRWTIVLGSAAYAARYLIFGTPGMPPAIVALAQGLHGFCFSCFFAAGFMYVERLAPKDIRHSAQTVFGIIILGVGPVVGGFFNGFMKQISTRTDDDGSTYVNYLVFWYASAAIAIVTGLVMAALFRDETAEPSPGENLAPVGQDVATELGEL